MVYEGFTTEGLTKVMEYLLGIDYTKKEQKLDVPEIPKEHKCWHCAWASFVGTGFYCPLVGCVKQTA